MKLKNFLMIFILLLVSDGVRGVTDNRNIPWILENLYSRIIRTSDNNEKLRLNDSIRLIIGDYAGSDSVFSHRFENLRYLGQIVSPDNKLKIITWNLLLTDNPNRYYCYIIKKDKKKENTNVLYLEGENREDDISADMLYNSKNWYGALYYAIQPFRKDRKDYYIVLGYDFGNVEVSRKLIDVMYFTSGGELALGLDCFVKGDDLKKREIMEYSPEGIFSLRLENSKLIVFDQLATILSGHGNGTELSGAGNSFDGYVLKKGLWRFISDIDLRNKKKDP